MESFVVNGIPSVIVASNLHKVEIIMEVALYFLLWINTKPRDEKDLEKKQLET
nr:hypothetical protein [uncultured Christensenella sp.]